ncbi:right-handed parallel beta-helix repeat-containing protein [Clostridium ganghwense]|uniref:Right-handed parallel beta-helix repeat-containing protein n=1 Tax=Clostridium ganghwense TaxID=312089 RepID=A0ABT4CT18_9CLOT|nr:right-handed parallel beta-helix repeat-containing protein [Clostridium ganghwense]MCY6372218.1 right-handed parallel beta-helix repeat-containing protein [Clostridium ganghwense]
MAIIYVPDDYTKIQDAVDAASPGDEIRVKDGSYNEAVSITKDNLHIIADGSNVVLDGETPTTLSEPAFHVSGCSNVKIEGFTIRHYNTELFIDNGSSNNTISQCAFSDIDSGIADGSGVSISNGSNNTISHCAFSHIGNPTGATGVWISFGSNNTICQCEFNNIEAYGVRILNSSNCNDITKNRIWNSHNGIKIQDSHNNNLISNQIWRNTDTDFSLENSNNNLISRNLIDSDTSQVFSINSSKNNSISRNMIRVDTRTDAGVINILDLSCNTFSKNTIEELTP